jgi:hypothetical protein
LSTQESPSLFSLKDAKRGNNTDVSAAAPRGEAAGMMREFRLNGCWYTSDQEDQLKKKARPSFRMSALLLN